MGKPVIPPEFSDRKWRLNNLYLIRDKSGHRVKFQMNMAQEILYEEMSWRNIILKARQLGFSTFIDIFILDQCLWNRDIKAGIIAHHIDDAKAIYDDKIKFPYDNLNPAVKQLLGPVKTDRTDQIEFNNGSSIRVSTSFRSGTLQCVTGDTEIVCKDGRIKPIQEISVGDLVLNDKGGYQKVGSLICNKREHELLDVSTFGHYNDLHITENHRVLTREKKTGKPTWKEAGDLKRGDYIAYPLREISNKCRDGNMAFGPSKWVYTNGRRSHAVGDRVRPSFTMGWLAGFYLAEGSIRSRHGKPPTDVTFSIHREETPKLLEALESIASHMDEKIKGELVNVYDYSGSLTTAVVVNSKKFAHHLSDRFGMGEDKFIPDSVWNLGEEYCKGLIKGYVDGDGSEKNVNQIQVTSARRQLITQLKMLLLSLRYGYPTIYYKPAGNHYGRDCKESWVLCLNGAGNWKFREKFGMPMPDVPDTWASRWRVEHGRRPEGKKRWRRGKKHYWAQVTSVKPSEREDEYVYDIALEESPHSYVTTTGIVHNCLHVSELGKIAAKYPDKAREIRTGAFEAVAQDQMIFVESTAEGAEGMFFEMCEDSRKLKDAGKKINPLDFKFHFFAWHEDPDYVADPSNVIFTTDLKRYFENLDVRGIKLSLEQMAWYVQKLASLGDDMTREYPSYPQEAFQASVEGAYYEKEMTTIRREGRICQVPYDPAYPVNTFWDLGMDDSMTIWFHQKIRAQHRLIDYLECHGEGFEYYARELKEKKYNYETHYMPHDASVRELGANARTRKQSAELVGIRPINVVERPRNTEALLAQIEQTRSFLRTCWIDEEKCAKGIVHLDKYRKEWDDRLGAYKRTPRHDQSCHGADGLRTGAVGYVEYVEYAEDDLIPEAFDD